MKTQTFNDLIEQINQAAGDVQRERGTLFEKLVLAYLKHEPTYRALYQMFGCYPMYLIIMVFLKKILV